MSERIEWAPNWAPHIKGWYEQRRVDDDGKPEETPCGATCSTCGANFRKMCLSGLFRNHIALFAKVHMHKDPMAPPK